MESGAGEQAWFDDAAYAEADATIVTRQELVSAADIILTVTKPDGALLGALRSGQAVIGMLNPLADPGLAADLAAKGVTAISLDGIPRTLSKTQPMDALSSQANIAGYKAALVAAATFGRFFPMLITAAGTARPAKVLVLGTGVAGCRPSGRPTGSGRWSPATTCARRARPRWNRSAPPSSSSPRWARRPVRAATHACSPTTSGRRSRPS